MTTQNVAHLAASRQALCRSHVPRPVVSRRHETAQDLPRALPSSPARIDRDQPRAFPDDDPQAEARVACRAFQERLAAGEVVKTKTAALASRPPKVLTLGRTARPVRGVSEDSAQATSGSWITPMHTLRRNLKASTSIARRASFTDDDLMDVRNTILKRAPSDVEQLPRLLQAGDEVGARGEAHPRQHRARRDEARTRDHA